MIKIYLHRCPVCKGSHYIQVRVEVSDDGKGLTYRGMCPFVRKEVVVSSECILEGVMEQERVTRGPGRPKKVVRE